jgi:heme A synthase
LNPSSSNLETRRFLATALTALIVVQWLAGITNVALLAPVWMQLLHLFLADLVWIALVLLAATDLAQRRAQLRKA